MPSPPSNITREVPHQLHRRTLLCRVDLRVADLGPSGVLHRTERGGLLRRVEDGLHLMCGEAIDRPVVAAGVALRVARLGGRPVQCAATVRAEDGQLRFLGDRVGDRQRGARVLQERDAVDGLGCYKYKGGVSSFFK